ncbi:Flp pilus assembly protein CpaB [Anaerobacillus arseniciselenatis]|uniref:Flp pilus assembly protein CpaB n=1 Tax=Anaerobacillus arseniciselenatis TaxID=85682 RepID=A0A1S2LQH2_9BACI|nr:Flp pilus assembly protein CpaB [Anaerobacillus arseniciselenatis]OIJ14636.1 Flp pilus assembly protein CpaB [Anaerobacillus arseniciselenatis]
MRSKFILLLAIVMGSITTILFYSYMKQYDATAAITESMVEVVVAAQPLKKNERITTDKVEVTSVPEKGLHPQAITSMEQLDGLIVNADISTGEVVLSHRVQREEDEKLFVSRKVKEGLRAVSVGVNFVQSVSNLVEPEDYVDVVFSEVIKVDGENIVNTELILENVRVLAVGRKLIESTSGENYMEYSAATLELTRDDTVRLVNASERGNIQLTLHSRVEEGS